MKKFLALLLGLCLVLSSMVGFAEGGALVPGTYEGYGEGFAGPDSVHVTLTVDENGITEAKIEGDAEVPFGVEAFATYEESLIGRADGEIDAVAGATMSVAIRRGVQRGVFSNEAGTGSSAMVHATAKVDVPVKQALYGIIEVFFDTFVICTFTALIIMVSGVPPAIHLFTGAVKFLIQEIYPVRPLCNRAQALYPKA